MLTSNEEIKKAVTEEPRPTINILIVVDGELSFDMEHKFGLGRFCVMLKNALSDLAPFHITTAHRQPQDDRTNADIHDFKFDEDRLKDYAEVWLLGYENNTVNGSRTQKDLNPNEYDALIAFMDRGGGIVAAGDHESLGETICGWVPRVRTMRKWAYKPEGDQPGNAPGRDESQNDTLVYDNAGAATNPEKDLSFQRIYPVPMAGPTVFGSAEERRIVHPIFSTVGGQIINFLPDHMHEGECIEDIVPDRKYGFGKYGVIARDNPGVAGKYVDRDEFPEAAAGYVEKPKIFAWSISVAGDKPEPFGCLAVYDGLKVRFNDIQHGRIVTISTWHQFINDNISAITTPAGLPDPQQVDIYKLISQYYRNIAKWAVGYQWSAKEEKYVNMQEELRARVFAIAMRSYLPLISLLGSVALGGVENKERKIADALYKGLLTVVSAAQVLEWAVDLYEEWFPGKRIELRNREGGYAPETITLLTDLEIGLFAKLVMALHFRPVLNSHLGNSARPARSLGGASEGGAVAVHNEWLPNLVDSLRRDLQTVSDKLEKLLNMPAAGRPGTNNIDGGIMTEEVMTKAAILADPLVFTWDNGAIVVKLGGPIATSFVDVLFEGSLAKRVEIFDISGTTMLDSVTSCSIIDGVGPYKKNQFQIGKEKGSFRVHPLQSSDPCMANPQTPIANKTLGVEHFNKKVGSSLVQVMTFYFSLGLGESIQITITIEDVSA